MSVTKTIDAHRKNLSNFFMSTLARKCVPFTPFDRELNKSRIVLVTAAGVHHKSQEPFNIGDELGDLTFRVIEGNVDVEDLMVTHHHYDHTDADRDINVVFPIERLRELQNEGFIGEVASEHIGYMGYSMQLKKMYEEVAPQIAGYVDKQVRADAVILTGGCPEVCHRTIVAVQREIEMRGISTVLITVSPTASQQMRPPRAIYPKGFQIGNSLGRPFMADLQKQVLRDALLQLKAAPRPGEVIEMQYPEYEKSETAKN
ncbi:MAG: glycine/sarcosine/betaine reductase selenoprotein B family protein [Acidobacteriota bacterium]